MKTPFTGVEVVWVVPLPRLEDRELTGPRKSWTAERLGQGEALTPPLGAFGSLQRRSERTSQSRGTLCVSLARLHLPANCFFPSLSLSKIRFLILTPTLSLLRKKSLILLEEERRHKTKVCFWRVYTRQYCACFLVVSQVPYLLPAPSILILRPLS